MPASTTASIESGGRTRTYRVHAPPAATGQASLPVVVLFHGRGSSGAAIEHDSGLLMTSDREGFLLVSPDGTGTPAGWSAGASMATWPVNDVDFGRDLVATIENDYCVDPGRIFAAGHSNGAFMAARFACAMPGLIAGVAAVAGVYVPGDGCGGAVPLIAFHGTADDIVPYGGGMVRDIYRYAGVQAEMTRWAAIDGCKGTPKTTKVATRLSVQEWSGCVATPKLVILDGGSHAWPQLPAATAGTEPSTAADLIWRFFRDTSAASR